MDNQTAINFLDQLRKVLLDDKSWLESTIQPINEAFDMAINALTAQSSSSCAHENDSISRQAAIDALDGEIEITGRTNAEAVKGYVRLVKDRLERLPSAQPDLSSYSDKLWRNAYERGRKDAMEEIIHCRDCENWDKTWTNDFSPNYHYCPMVDGVRKDNFYCADAERRKDG